MMSEFEQPVASEIAKANLDECTSWIGERVCLGLTIPVSSFVSALEEKGSDKPANERFLCEFDGLEYCLRVFFSKKTLDGTSLFFYELNEEVEVEINEEDETASSSVAEGSAVDDDGQKKRTKKVWQPRLKCSLNDVHPDAQRVQQMYFLRKADGAISSMKDLDSMVEFGTISDDVLDDLEMIMEEVYGALLDVKESSAPVPGSTSSLAGIEDDAIESTVPLAAAHIVEAASPIKASSSSTSGKMMNDIKNELKLNLAKFEAQVSYAHVQVQGDVHLAMPPDSITNEIDESNYESLSKKEGVLEAIETVADSWCKQMVTMMDAELSKVASGDGPLAEIEYWRARSSALSTIYEQLNMPKVQLLIKNIERNIFKWAHQIINTLCDLINAT